LESGNVKPSKHSATLSQLIAKAPVERVDDLVRLKITKQEAAALRKWGAARGDRAPRWVARMQKAMHLVAVAIGVHGTERYDLLVKAAKIVAALREPRTNRVPFEILTFQRSEWLLEVAIGKLGDCVGCLAMGASTADKQIYASVKRIVNKADPIGLLRAGAPDDEYHPEIDEIACRLPEPECQSVAKTQAVVHRVFVKWFGTRTAGPRSAHRKLATALHALRPRRARPRTRLPATSRQPGSKNVRTPASTPSRETR